MTTRGRVIVFLTVLTAFTAAEVVFVGLGMTAAAATTAVLALAGGAATVALRLAGGRTK